MTVDLPRIPLSDFRSGSADVKEQFLRLMHQHSFVLLTDIGIGEKLYSEFIESFEDFLQNTPEEEKQQCQGPIFANERGTPMWHVGYERSGMRECWRYPTAQCNPGGHDYVQNTKWPGVDYRERNLALTRFLKEICDSALVLSGLQVPEGDEEDICTTFAFNYPNSEGEGYNPQLPGILVKEHIDESIFVAEYVPFVRGLEVFDCKSQQWLMVEDHCMSGKEIVVFAGEGLELLAHRLPDPIPACNHRVAESKGQSRSVFIFEQKYVSYMKEGKAALRERKQAEQAQQASESDVPSAHGGDMFAYYMALQQAQMAEDGEKGEAEEGAIDEAEQ